MPTCRWRVLVLMRHLENPRCPGTSAASHRALASAQTFTGTASNFTGPGAPGDPAYTIADGAASYGTVASGATASCSAATNCYALGTTVPTTRPALHWDATFREDISPANLGAAKTWTLHIGDSFADVSHDASDPHLKNRTPVDGGEKPNVSGETTPQRITVAALVALVIPN